MWSASVDCPAGSRIRDQRSQAAICHDRAHSADNRGRLQNKNGPSRVNGRSRGPSTYASRTCDGPRALQRPQEVDEGVVDFARPFLLEPVTGAGQDLRHSQPRHGARQGGDGLGCVAGD